MNFVNQIRLRSGNQHLIQGRNMPRSEIPATYWWAPELRRLRLEAGLTVAQAAKKAGVTAQAWRYTESGRSAPVITTLTWMFGVFGKKVGLL